MARSSHRPEDAITRSPIITNLTPGTTHTFVVEAIGPGPNGWQHYRNFSNVITVTTPIAPTATLAVAGVAAADKVTVGKYVMVNVDHDDDNRDAHRDDPSNRSGD